MAAFGVDISEYQEGISVRRLRDEGAEFAILRCGGTGSSSGKPFTDGCFDAFYNECKAVGMPIGVYYYSMAHDSVTAREEADYVIGLLRGRQIEYGVWYDVEDEWHVEASRSNPSRLADVVTNFCARVEGAGHWCGLYSWPWLMEACGPALDRFDKWPCQWSTERPTISHGLWQFGGHVNELRNPTIAGYVCDQDYAYKDYPALMRAHGLGGYAKMSTPIEDNDVEKMDAPALTPQQRVVHSLLAEVGYVADPGKFTKYAAELDQTDTYNGPKNGYDWCDVHYDWHIIHNFGVDLGQRMLCQPKRGGGAGCWISAQYYRDAGRWGSSPRLAAQIFFLDDEGSEGHTGGVVGYDETNVYTVEGNTGYGEGYSSGAVFKRSYRRDDPCIAGYGYPVWSLAGGSDYVEGSGSADYMSEPRNCRDGGKLDTDGDAGWNTLVDWQHQLGTKEDGEISDQWVGNDAFHWAVSAAVHTDGDDDGSTLVRVVQAIVGAHVDGQWGRETSTKLQLFLIAHGYDCGKAGADGYFGRESVRALQRSLNDGMWAEWSGGDLRWAA